MSVYDRIREKIVRNEISPGERISIDALVRELGVSQTPVREALRQLEGDRLVTRARGRGYAATPLLDKTSLRHMFEVRLLIEPWAAKVTAADRATNPGPELLELIATFRSEHPGVCSRTFLVTHDLEFHRTIHRATANRFLNEVYAGLHSQLHLFRLYDEDVDGTETLDEHGAVASAIAACDPAAAESAMRSHLVCSLRRSLLELGAEAASGEPVPDSGRVITPGSDQP